MGEARQQDVVRDLRSPAATGRRWSGGAEAAEDDTGDGGFGRGDRDGSTEPRDLDPGRDLGRDLGHDADRATGLDPAVQRGTDRVEDREGAGTGEPTLLGRGTTGPNGQGPAEQGQAGEGVD